jgi:hypothetical protein
MSHTNIPRATGEPADGRSDFDFLFGSWRVVNRRLADPLDPTGSAWIEFETIAAARPLLGGLGNTDTYDSAGDVPFHGITLRLFDPNMRLWRIWWASTSRPGHLDPPMEARFEGSHGVFHGKDVIVGIDIDVRFDWHVDGPDRARWRQAFSRDRRRTWSENFTMDFFRTTER